MLAASLPGLLPSMTEDDALDAAAVQSLASGGFRVERWRQRPFRAPHHTASAVALVGGGGDPGPGEISLAHRGVLFLDELPEFSRAALEALREPLEERAVHVSRVRGVQRLPARFQLVAAMNPCPCGFRGVALRPCRSTPARVADYQGRISGPLLDRFDLWADVPLLRFDDIDGNT